METEVLVAGAGPTGLALALWLTRLGIRVRVVDKSDKPATSSRAVVIQPRTLELYRQLDLARPVVEAGHEFGMLTFWAKGRKVARVAFGRPGLGLSPFPFGLIYPQDQHERLLGEKLDELGVQVERNTELTGFEESGGKVVAHLRTLEGQQLCEAAMLAGCDGAHSAVRERLGIQFPGGTYTHLFYVADVEAAGPVVDRELHISLDKGDFAGVFPLREEGRVRLIGEVRPQAAGKGDDLGWEDVNKRILGRLGLQVREVNWFSTYRVHHRVAAQFRRGRAFLLGDAAHIHSPVGGQGMNTGIGDAINLAWKLAAVLRGRADPGLLDTYERERIGFARRLVATTDRIFQLVTSQGPLAERIRLEVVPRLAAALFRLPSVRRYVFRTASQISIEYRKSSLSVGRAGGVHGGDRLPWVRPEAGEEDDNFSPLDAVGWHVQIHGRARPSLIACCASHRLPLHVFPWTGSAAAAGFSRDASYLVRPDGYIALADPLQGRDRLERYLDERGLRPPAAPGSAWLGTGSAEQHP
jgi:2-polyprenyl-6-methoxyphenol hydroxylase-like FAD-dependent oxidoreductase